MAPPEILARPEGAAVAGWQQLVLHLSEVPTGSRTVLVLLDADGRPISASDDVLYRIAQPDGMVRFEMESAPLEATPSTPSDEDVAAIKALVAEVIRRAS